MKLVVAGGLAAIVAVVGLVLAVPAAAASGDENVTVVAPATEAAEALDLHAVAELFEDSMNLEEFEKSLNDPKKGINNLDLDDNGEVDFIRVLEEAKDEEHLVVLQAVLGDNEYQDVATITVERGEGGGKDEYHMHVRGSVLIYGPDYYVVPDVVQVHAWPIVVWMYGPAWHPYRSVWRFGHYPRWWRRHRPLTVAVYHKRTVRYTRRAHFHVTRVTRFRSVRHVKYKPVSSTRVKKTKVTVRKGPRGTKVKKKTTVRRRKH